MPKPGTAIPVARSIGPVPSRLRVWLALLAFVVAAALPTKEAALAIAVLFLVGFRPLDLNQVWLVLIRCWPIMTMLAIGLIMTAIDVTGELDRRAVVRIAFYYVRVPIFLLLGFAARRYVSDDRPLLWAVVALGVWGAGQTMFRFATGGSLAGLSHNEIRSVVGSGDTISMLIPLCTLVLWSRTRLAVPRAVLLGATGMALLAAVAASSRTGLLVLAISLLLSLPKLPVLPVARWSAVAVLIGTFIITTPTLLPILHFLNIDPLQLSGLSEVIARPRTDLQSINDQWRGYETFMAFSAATRDGLLPFLFGHGMSVYAPLGVLIELAPGELFDRADVFHNGWSFIVLHSGLLGTALYIAQFYIFAKPPATSAGLTLRSDNRLFTLILLSLAANTAVVAGVFNAGTFASSQLFMLGCFYPFSLVPLPKQVATAVMNGRERDAPIGRSGLLV